MACFADRNDPFCNTLTISVLHRGVKSGRNSGEKRHAEAPKRQLVRNIYAGRMYFYAPSRIAHCPNKPPHKQKRTKNLAHAIRLCAIFKARRFKIL